MAKATKGSAGPRIAAEDPSTRDQTTATARHASKEPEVRSSPRKAPSAKSGPVRSGPVKKGRAKASPVKAGPVKAGPVKASPVKAGPVKASPVKVRPVKTTPAAPARSAPAKAAPTRAGSAKAGPAEPAASKTGTGRATRRAPRTSTVVQPDTAQVALTRTAPAKSESAALNATKPVAAKTETGAGIPKTIIQETPRLRSTVGARQTLTTSGEGVATITRDPGITPTVDRPAASDPVPVPSPTAADRSPLTPLAPLPPLTPPAPPFTPPFASPSTATGEAPPPMLFGGGEPKPSTGLPIILLPPYGDPVIEPPSVQDESAPATQKLLRRRRLTSVLAFVGIAAAVLMVGQIVRTSDGPSVTTIAPVASALAPAPLPGGGKAPTAESDTDATSGAATGATVPDPNSGDRPPVDTPDGTPTRDLGKNKAFRYAAGYGPVLGTAGTLRRFKVAVERTLEQGNAGDFADEIDEALGDSRGWTASRKLRFQRVPGSSEAEFTIYLAAPHTSKRMCAAGGLSTDTFTSCRLPGQVIINNDRWQDGTSDYDAPLRTYRAYTINHEVGHQLGHGHEACAGAGSPAPVMQQQTYGLKGCVANAWPYLDGKRNSGEPIE